MPKVSDSHSSKVRGWLKTLKLESDFTFDGRVAFCQPCGKQINCERKSQLDQHIKSCGHVAALQREKTKRQQLLTVTTCTGKKDAFTEDLCFALISADIPFHKLKNLELKHFLEKYTNNRIPDESTARKNYVDLCYQKTLNLLREHIGKNYFYLIVDETTDVRGNYIASVLIGKLHPEEPGRAYLLATKVLEKTNHETICRFVNESIKIVCNDEKAGDRFLLLLTDAAPYMTKSGKILKTFFKNLIHVTCVAHALNLIAEKIREIFPKLNSLINQGKKIFSKAPSRVAVYRENMDVALPPIPVLTRWGTWLVAALFYAENWGKYTEVIRKLKENESDSAQSLNKVGALVDDPEIVRSLTFIKSHCSFLKDSLKRLESRDLSLKESVEILQEVEMKIDKIPGENGKLLKNKKDFVLSKNTGLKTLISIKKIIFDESQEDIGEDPAIISSFKYAPITSVEVERSFSMFKNILSDRRHNFTEENLEKYLFINFNYSNLK